MLARRDLSEGEIRSRLLAREYPEAEVAGVIARLRERRYLDDRALALAAARSRAERRHEGPLKVVAHLRKRQIPDELVRDAIREAFPEGSEIERAALALARLRRTSRRRENDGQDNGQDDRRNDREKLLRRLLARGYSWEAARGAVFEREPVPEPPATGHPVEGSAP